MEADESMNMVIVWRCGSQKPLVGKHQSAFAKSPNTSEAVKLFSSEKNGPKLWQKNYFESNSTNDRYIGNSTCEDKPDENRFN